MLSLAPPGRASVAGNTEWTQHPASRFAISRDGGAAISTLDRVINPRSGRLFERVPRKQTGYWTSFGCGGILWTSGTTVALPGDLDSRATQPGPGSHSREDVDSHPPRPEGTTPSAPNGAKE